MPVELNTMTVGASVEYSASVVQRFPSALPELGGQLECDDQIVQVAVTP